MPSPSNALPFAMTEALADGGLLLTPNERSAAEMRARFDRELLASASSAWQPAAISSWNTWLRRQWDDLLTLGAESRLLLNPAQEHLLWREIIAAAPQSTAFGSLDALATLAARTWKLACSYQASVDDLRHFGSTYDARTFAQWAAAFRRRCEQRQYLVAAELEGTLAAHVRSGTMPLPRSLTLLGFDDDTPARTALLDALGEHGTDIQRVEPTAEAAAEPAAGLPARPPARTIVRCSHLQQEAEAAARWIRSFFDLHREAASSETPRVALVVPTLAEERQNLDGILRDALAPELQSIEADLSSAPYAFATGEKLADTTLASSALGVLRWMVAPLPIEHISALLLSPYFGSFESLERRAAFDAFTLRHAAVLRPELTIAKVLRLATSEPAVAQMLTPLAAQANRIAGASRSFAEWMEAVRATLHEVAFPGDRPLTAQEFQTLGTWERALDTVATLDFTGERVSFRAALDALERVCREASIPSSSAAPVQVISPSDVPGSTFDALLFLRATDLNWPVVERASPLLGWAFQADRHMPGTDTALAAARSERATQRLAAVAPQVLFFYSAEGESGPQSLSPLVERLHWPLVDAASLLPPPAAPIVELETVEDDAPLPPPPSASVRGGALVLKLQAACGFRAFAELRLNASGIDDTVAGFDARQSGIVLHEAMHRFWTEVGSQAALRAMPRVVRADKLRDAVEAAMAHTTQDGPWDAAYLDVQKERLRSLLLKWLELELSRSDFTVQAGEQQREVTVGPLQLQLRVDRIDQVDDGLLIVDYKTGAGPAPKHWEGERPEEPQLPLYALLPEAAGLQGVAFAKVLPGKEMKWAGYAAAGQLPKPARIEHGTLEDQLTAWRFVLERLASDFYDGKADVDPKNYPMTCTHCAQRLLCRLDVSALALDEDDSAEAADAV